MKLKNTFISPWFFLASIASIAAIGFHLYLTYHYYIQKIGLTTGESICNINATFNCDVVSSSPYASLFGVPLALLGSLTNFIFLLLLVLYYFYLKNTKELIGRWIILLLILITSMSVIMGSIASFAIGTFCIFCIGTYICSALQLWGFWKIGPQTKFLKRTDLSYTKNNLAVLGLFAMIPTASITSHMIISSYTDLDTIHEMVERNVAIWAANPKLNFDYKQGIIVGEKNSPKLILLEYSDFLCPHCRNIVPVIENFANIHRDVQVVLKIFALDGTCSPGLPVGNGVRCQLSAAAWCAEEQGFGWLAYQWIFNHQLEWSSPYVVDEKLELMSSTIGLNWEKLKLCLKSDKTIEVLNAQATEAINAQIHGTPTVIIEGKIVPGPNLPMLNAIYDEVVKAK